MAFLPAGTKVSFTGHNWSLPKKGLSYPAGEGVLAEDAATGGWDVYDLTDGRSIYGFSIKKWSKKRTKTRSNPKAFEFDVSFVVEFEDYYQGCGMGRFDEAATGIGDSAAEALEDAFEQLSQVDALTTAQEEAIKAECIRDMGKAKFNKKHRLQEGEWVYCCLKVSR